ncbi:MAG: NAD+ synthase, partial [Opitutales bacterium]|nr:NAD+ synthase [Opitutales bacterium]
FNSAAFIEGGKIKSVCDKRLLPNYGIFDEPRNFDAGSEAGIVEFKGVKIGVTICEDIWADDPQTAPRYANSFRPLDAIKDAKCGVVINMASSLWSPENDAARFSLLKNAARHAGASLAFCNLVGGNDEFVCAGGSAIVSKDGEYCGALKKFAEDLAVFDAENLSPCEIEKPDRIAELYEALKMSLGDFVRKSGFKKAALGLSGGIDSALVAALACDALGAENVIGISLPSKFSSGHSVKDARDLAKNLGLVYDNISIEKIVAEAEGALSKIFAGLPRDVTEENLQSRARGLVMMAVSNKLGAMVLATGNKSECAVGYCTLYGDTCGGFAPIADVYKTDVFRLARYINRDGEKIPENTITKPPSAELRPGQKDSDSLPEYDILDAILHAYIEENLPISKIVERGFDRGVVEDVARKFERCEYKRRQLPPAPRLTPSSFGAGRRVALTGKKNYEFR